MLTTRRAFGTTWIRTSRPSCDVRLDRSPSAWPCRCRPRDLSRTPVQQRQISRRLALSQRNRFSLTRLVVHAQLVIGEEKQGRDDIVRRHAQEGNQELFGIIRKGASSAEGMLADCHDFV